MMIEKFSYKQLQVLTWWMPDSSHAACTGIICDGAVRSGKTMSMGLSFFLWAMFCFHSQQFALCGKTREAVRRNLLWDVLPRLKRLGFCIREDRSRGLLDVVYRGHRNRFHLFGGYHESSQDLIQGMTLAGALLDEAALMPRSFVEQTAARCSVEGAKLWLSCNPAGPRHWLYEQWICKAEEKQLLYLHFTMHDNPGLSDSVKARYETMYTGVFYQRYVLGKWVLAEGRVYDFFDAAKAPPAPKNGFVRWYISCDYGTTNPASFGLWGLKDNVWYRVREYYHDSEKTGRQLTDAEYVQKLRELAGDLPIEAVIADPSAASFLAALRREGFCVRKGKNDVLSGIRITATLLKQGRLVICRECRDCLREMDEYVWAEGDKVKKEHDHAMDDMRYFAATVVAPDAEASLCALSVSRRK